MNYEALKAEILRDEGIRLKPYRDTRGILTIGIGRNLENGLSRNEAFLLLDNDIRQAMKDLDRNIEWWRGLPDTVQRGLVNMCFNLGWPRLSQFKRMLAALARDQFNHAAEEALDSKWANQVGARSILIVELFRQGENL